MTDGTQDLDEIILGLARYANTLTPYKLDEPIDPLTADSLADIEQALLDWHNKQIEAVLDRLLDQRMLARDRDTYELSDPMIPMSAVIAERNKLKESK